MNIIRDLKPTKNGQRTYAERVWTVNGHACKACVAIDTAFPGQSNVHLDVWREPHGWVTVSRRQGHECVTGGPSFFTARSSDDLIDALECEAYAILGIEVEA